jgi:hypothetical protein
MQRPVLLTDANTVSKSHGSSVLARPHLEVKPPRDQEMHVTCSLAQRSPRSLASSRPSCPPPPRRKEGRTGKSEDVAEKGGGENDEWRTKLSKRITVPIPQTLHEA